jgi:flagellar motility protein MotE (MotC chaperone)
MTRLLRDVRLVPIVLIAIICLFALKSFGLIFNGGYALNEPPPAVDPNDLAVGWVGAPKDRDPASPVQKKSVPKQSWAQRVFNFPDITGSVPQGNSPADALAKTTARPTEQGAGSKQMSVAERAILERLSERRGELDARAKDLDMRENLLKAAEKRLEGRINELKELEARVNTAMQTKTDGEAARFKNLVTMYESMKAKEAAKIFDRLDMRVLIEVATQINPRRMSDILAQMTPEAAERLTIELAVRAKDNKAATPELPKIEGRPAN